MPMNPWVSAMMCLGFLMCSKAPASALFEILDRLPPSCSDFTCPESPLRAHVLSNSVRGSALFQKMRLAAGRHVVNLWPDTVLEGDFEFATDHDAILSGPGAQILDLEEIQDARGMTLGFRCWIGVRVTWERQRQGTYYESLIFKADLKEARHDRFRPSFFDPEKSLTGEQSGLRSAP